jgi:hypothetical protein
MAETIPISALAAMQPAKPVPPADAGYESARGRCLERFAAVGAKSDNDHTRAGGAGVAFPGTLRSGGIFVAQIPIATTGKKRRGANWALLHLDGNRTLEPAIEELLRPVQTRYDLDW